MTDAHQPTNSAGRVIGGAQRTGIVARPYNKDDAEAWERLVAESWNGTFLHQRKFLSYHGDRFQDLSLILEDRRGSIVGVFPAAIDPLWEERVVSHPGLTYGGIVHTGSLQGNLMLEALQTIVEAYRAAGLRFLRYRAVPYIYHRVASADDLYALFRLGGVRYRCDLSTTIDLTRRPRPSKLRRRSLNKALRSGVQIKSGACHLKPFWPVLEVNLATKHRTHPVHTLGEITRLHSMFPKQIECVVGTKKDEVIAGVVLFCTHQVVHAQYIGSSALGQELAAPTAVLEHAIEISKEWGAQYFDFGISTEDEGRVLNAGLQKFKGSFGAGTVLYETYELNLEHELLDPPNR